MNAKLAPLLDIDREKPIARFVAELLDIYTVSDELYAVTEAALGDLDPILVELVSNVRYHFVAFTLNTFRIPSKAPDFTISK